MFWRAALISLAISWIAQPALAQAQPDSLKVIFCGTSGPLPIKDRAKACTAIQAGGALYLVDIGPEATEVLMGLRLPLAEAKAVFITHFHSDHIGDLGEFNMQSWVAGRPSALAVVGPPGVDQLASGFNQAYQLDHGYRRAHHEHDGITLPIATGELKAKTVKLPAKGTHTAIAWTDGALTVTAIEVSHDPVTPAYGYRFDYKGRSVVISGDTKAWPPLAEAAKGADVLIHEGQNSDMTKTLVTFLRNSGQARTASIMTDTLSYHTTPVEAAGLAKTAGVKLLVLSHLTQAGLPFFTPEAFLKGVADVGGPEMKLAKDAMVIELPVGSSEVKVSQR